MLATASSVGGPFTVTIEGLAAPATFTRLSAAAAAIWESIRCLPLGSNQYEAYRAFFGPGAAERIEAFLGRGELVLTFALGGEIHAVRIAQSASRKNRHDGTPSASASR